jgi:hypothetical protein
MRTFYWGKFVTNRKHIRHDACVNRESKLLTKIVSEYMYLWFVISQNHTDYFCRWTVITDVIIKSHCARSLISCTMFTWFYIIGVGGPDHLPSSRIALTCWGVSSVRTGLMETGTDLRWDDVTRCDHHHTDSPSRLRVIARPLHHHLQLSCEFIIIVLPLCLQ